MRSKLYVEAKCHICGSTSKINLKSIDLFLYDENNISSLLVENGWGSIGDNKVCGRCLEHINRIIPSSSAFIQANENKSRPVMLKVKSE